MLDTILLILGILWFFITLVFCFVITININDNNVKSGSLIAIKEFIKKLFCERNTFGIILSVITLVIAIPAFLLILITQFLFWICYLMIRIWNLGNMKQK